MGWNAARGRKWGTRKRDGKVQVKGEKKEGCLLVRFRVGDENEG